MKVLIVILFLAIVASLGSALMFLMQDRGGSSRMAWALGSSRCLASPSILLRSSFEIRKLIW